MALGASPVEDQTTGGEDVILNLPFRPLVFYGAPDLPVMQDRRDEDERDDRRSTINYRFARTPSSFSKSLPHKINHAKRPVRIIARPRRIEQLVCGSVGCIAAAKLQSPQLIDQDRLAAGVF